MTDDFFSVSMEIALQRQDVDYDPSWRVPTRQSECGHETTEYVEDEETLEISEICLDCGKLIQAYNPLHVDRPLSTCASCGIKYDPWHESSGNSRCADCYN